MDCVVEQGPTPTFCVRGARVTGACATLGFVGADAEALGTFLGVGHDQGFAMSVNCDGAVAVYHYLDDKAPGASLSDPFADPTLAISSCHG
jgi:hypothetical protein